MNLSILQISNIIIQEGIGKAVFPLYTVRLKIKVTVRGMGV